MAGVSFFRSGSVYRLFWGIIFLVALLPAAGVTSTLLNRLVDQSHEQIRNNLKYRAELQATLLERQFKLQLGSFLQLSQISDVKLTPLSAMFGYQAGLQLKNYVEQSVMASASFILNRENWLVEVYPFSVEGLSLDAIYHQVTPFLKQVEQTQLIKPLMFDLNDPTLVRRLKSNRVQHSSNVSSWCKVMVLPLIQETEYEQTDFRVVGSLVSVEPYLHFSQILDAWLPEGSSVQLFDNKNLIYAYGTDELPQQVENSVSWERPVNLGEHQLVLRLTDRLPGLISLLFGETWRLTTMVLTVLVLAGGISLLVTKRVSLQLKKLMQHLTAFANGDYQYRAADLRFVEFVTIADGLEKLAQKVNSDQSQLEAKVFERSQELHLANAELIRIVEELKQAQHQLLQSQKMASLGLMVSGIAHELNTPLGVCVTAIGVVGDQGRALEKLLLGERIKKNELIETLHALTQAVALIKRNMRRANALVSLFNELSLGTDENKVYHFELKQYLLMQAERWRQLEGADIIDISVQGEEMFVQTYRESLTKVLALLFDNIVEHVAGNISDPVAPAKVEICCRLEDENVHLTVSDNGPGVEVDPVEKVFEPFYTTKRHKGRVGLGLHLVYNLVTQRLHGEIDVENRDPTGFRVSLVFPQVRRDESRTNGLA